MSHRKAILIAVAAVLGVCVLGYCVVAGYWVLISL